MPRYKEQMLQVIAAKARRRLGQLASELIRAEPGERERALASLEFERWLATRCEQALQRPDN